MFQHTAARRRLETMIGVVIGRIDSFNTQPPEGGWSAQIVAEWLHEVSTHSRPKAAGHGRSSYARRWCVSTHSRPKAAGLSMSCYRLLPTCFNTQPPEGGWVDTV